MLKSIRLFGLGWLVIVLVGVVYYQFVLWGKIPVPADTLVGAYYPWLDEKWGYITGVPVKNPPISDVFSQFFVWKYLGVEYLKQGWLPLWNPYSFAGTPFLGTYHSAPFLPFNILLFLPKYSGWAVFIMGQTMCACVGMYVLLRQWVKSGISAVGGAIVFGLSGLMTTWTEFGTGVWSASMLPWIIWGVVKYNSTKKYRYLVGVAIFFGCLFLAGHAQLSLYSSVLFGCYVLICNRELMWLEKIKLGIFWGLGAGMGAIALLPSVDTATLSVRAAEAYSRTFNYGLSQIGDIMRLLVADFYGNPTTYNHWGAASYHEQSSFLGSLSVVLIVTILISGYWRRVKFWLVVFGVSIFLAFDNPVTRLLYSLPLPFLTYSSASRTFFVTSFAGAILVGFGLDWYIDSDSFRRKLKWAIVGLLGMIGIGLLCLGGGDQANTHLKIAFRNSLMTIGLLVSALVLAQIRLQRRWLVWIIVVMIFFDLSRYFWKYNPFVDSKIVFPSTPVDNFLTKNIGEYRIARIDREIMPPNTWVYYHLQSVEGYDPLALENYARVFNMINKQNYQNGLSRYMELSDYKSKWLDALGVRYFLAVKRDEKGRIPGNTFSEAVLNTGYPRVFESKNSVVLENNQAKERAFFVKRVVNVDSKSSLVEHISQKDFDPTTDAVVIDSKSANIAGVSSAKILDYSPNRVVVKTEGEGGFLVLADTYEKGWQVKVDGRLEKLYEVDGALRGVWVDAGSRTVEFWYLPRAFMIGAVLSSLSAISLLMVGMVTSARRRW